MDLTQSLVEKCSIGELVKLGRQYKIQYSTTWELRQKLMVQIMKSNGSVVELSGFTETVKQEKEDTLKEDEKRREKLQIYLQKITEIYETIKGFEKIKEPSRNDNILEEKDDPLITCIKNQMPNADEDFKHMSNIVNVKPDCSLLICGDSGAGKSSFINLLMGDEVLPTSIRSNSSCQVRLSYGEPERAEVVDNDSVTHVIEKSRFETDLPKFLENLDDRGTISCKSATIFLKSLILEGGLDIYDTIGLGESEKFNDDLRKKLNQITGIIFLLKKNNPIGDTMIGGLSEIILSLAVNGLPWSSMHFIINMCDLLQGAGEKEALKKNVSEQLRDKCSHFNPEISTFSTKQELDFQKNNVMSTNYKDIIQLIKQLHISSINSNTVKVFNFLINFVIQTIDQISDIEKYAASNKQERKDYIFRLRNLESDRKLINESFKKKNKKDLNNEKRLCMKVIQDYFREEETKKAIVEIVLNRQAVLHGMAVIDEIDKMIATMTQEEILKSFKYYIDNKQILKNCCDKMILSFVQQFAEHQKNKQLIYTQMDKHIIEIMDGMEGAIARDIMASPSQNTVFINLVSPILMPIVKVKDYIIKKSWFANFLSAFNNANIQTFYKDTSTHVTKQSANAYSKYFGKKSNIAHMMECLFAAPEKVTRDFEKYLEEDMDYLAKNIQSLEDDMRKKEKVFDTYKEIKKELVSIQEDLCKFSLLHLQKEKKHIMVEKIKLLPLPNATDGQIKPILKGRNRIVFYGQIATDLSFDSCVMIYKNKDGKSWKDFYEEYRWHNVLRRIGSQQEYLELSKCFLELKLHVLFYMRCEDPMDPTFIVNGIEISINSHMYQRRESMRNETTHYEQELFEEISHILKQILNGLSYLHSKKLVHYDITGDSIGYSPTYRSVKLTSISLPTKVTLKYNKESEKYVLKRAYLPISILDENTNSPYVEESDMYCLGMLIYSMWLGTDPFFDFIVREQIKTITNFVAAVKKTDVESITMTNNFEHTFALIIYDWFKRCRNGQLTSTAFFEELQRIRFYGRKED